MMDFKNKRVMVVGRGVSGQGAYEALTNQGARCFFYQCEADFFGGIDLVVVSPGIPATDRVFALSRQKKVPLIGEIELGFLLCTKPIIAVSGTNGKTTITELIGKILEFDGKKPLVAGNIGLSFSSVAARDDYDIAVVEVSSFQLETTKEFRPHIAIISNITEDHLDRHKTLSKYADAKLKIAKNQTQDDYLIITEGVKKFLPKCGIKSQICCIDDPQSTAPTCHIHEQNVYFGDKLVFGREEIAMKGEHNLINAMLCTNACKLLGTSDDAIRQALRLFTPRAYRMALTGEHNGKKYYNDSKGTNIDACLSATKAMQGSTCLILGGSDKGYSFSGLFDSLPSTIVKIFAVGQTADKILQAAARCGFGNIERADSIRAATLAASALEVNNVLLSPAAASFDSYENYQERGRDFDGIVAEIMQSSGEKWT